MKGICVFIGTALVLAACSLPCAAADSNADFNQLAQSAAAAYDAKCLACHSASQTANARSCPVADSGCTTCHMPKVDSPGMHQPFTDHQIRIVRAGEAYPD